MKKIGAIYIRVSTDKQEELSPDAQLRLLLEYAERNNIAIPKEYIFQDNGISGRKAEKRPNFQKMIAISKSKEHPIDCIIVWKFSRFARNQEESILYKSLLRKNNVDVLSISENTTGEFGTLIERIIEWMDEYYSIRLSGEVFRGMSESAMRGNYLTKPPIGYLKGNRKGEPPIIDEQTKIIPLTMKKLFYEDYSCRRIALYCNNMGWRTRNGNLYEGRDVEYILLNPFYAGIARWNYAEQNRQLKPAEEVIYAEGNWLALWSVEEWKEMSNRINARQKPYSDHKKTRDISTCKHWLSGIVKCSSCGRSLSHCGSQFGNFQCWGFLKGKCSQTHSISEKKLTTFVLDGLKSLLASDNIPYHVVKRAPLDDAVQIEELQKQLLRLDNREARAKTAYLDGIDSKEEYRTNKEQIQVERTSLEEKINRLSNKSDISVSKAELDAILIQNIQDVILVLENPHKDYIEKGEAIRSIVDQIIFNRENFSLDFSLRLEI